MCLAVVSDIKALMGGGVKEQDKFAGVYLNHHGP